VQFLLILRLVCAQNNSAMKVDVEYQNLITLHSALGFIYKLLFKSCRFAPQCLRKTKSQQSTRQLFYIIVLFTSVHLQICPLCTSSITLSLPVDLFFPNFLYICDIRSVFLYLLVVAFMTLLDDLFFCILI
jgi:hypothetical protein